MECKQAAWFKHFTIPDGNGEIILRLPDQQSRRRCCGSVHFREDAQTDPRSHTAAANAQDGISLVQSAEGALNEVHDMLHRAGELAVKAANGTLSDDEREMVDAEIQQLKAEIDTTANHTVFNELRLFPTTGFPQERLRTEDGQL